MPSRILRLWNPDASAWEEVGDSRLTAHLAAADPHPQYLTAGEGGGGGGLATDPLADAKGDLFAASGADAIGRLALGTDGQVLTADSAQTLGVRWATPAAGGGGAYVDEAGDTMTGTLVFSGAGVVSGGAVRVLGTGATDARTYGTAAGFGPTETSQTGERGLRFHHPQAAFLVAVRWYRVDPTQVVPGSVRLWDTTNTATPVWSSATPAEWSNTVAGWKEHRLAAGTQPALVAGRPYVVSYSVPSGTNTTRHTGYTPTPDAPLVFDAHGIAASGGAFPGTGSADAWGIDAVVRTSLSASTPAASGAIRLPNGSDGALAWRNQGDTADLALTVNTSNALAFNGAALLTQATADPLYLSPTEGDAAYLKLTGGQLTGNLGVGVAPAAWWSDAKAIQVGAAGSLWAAASASTTEVGDNTRYDGTNRVAMLTPSAPATFFRQAGGVTTIQTAPAVAAGAAQTFTTRLQVAQTGTVTVTPDGGQDALSAQGHVRLATGAELTGASHLGLRLPGSGFAFYPAQDNSYNLGSGTNRWGTVYATVGAINTSLAEAKQDLTPLSPEDALAAVRATDPVQFSYKPPERGPEWYELPDDPEQAEQVLQQRLTAAPLEAGARHQAGFVLQDESGTYHTDPLFECGPGQSAPSHTAGILLAAIKALDTRLLALEGA